MKELLTYLLQVIISSLLLYAYYHFALRNNKFHRYNRFYLLFSVITSVSIPFLNIPVYFSAVETDNSAILQTLRVIAFAGAEKNVIGDYENGTSLRVLLTPTNIVWGIYLFVAFFILLRIILSIIKIRQIIHKNNIEKINSIYFINTTEPGTPFSFFRWLFWNKKIDLQSEKGEQIFKHELFHIKEKHSWDIMFMELLTVIFWINPFFHLIKREIKAIHEFLADEFAMKKNEEWQYAELLLMQAFNTSSNLVNPFFHNQINRRIAMITTSKKPSYQYLRKIMVLPVAILITALFAFSYKSKPDLSDSAINSYKTITTTLNAGENSLGGKYSVTENKVADTVKPTVKSTDMDIMLVVIDEIVQPKKGLKNVSDTSLISQANILSVNILKGKSAADKYGEKGKDGVIELFTKSNAGKVKTIVVEGKPLNKSDLAEVVVVGKPIESRPLIVLDGKEMPGMDLNKLENFTPASDIESINILKDKTATDKYGDKGKNGVIEIITKKKTILMSIEENKVDVERVFVKVETPPSFPGGEKEWSKFLERNLNPQVAVNNGCKSGTFKVLIRFIVDKEGNIKNVTALTKNGYGLEDHVGSLIANGPKWIPAFQNGYKVPAFNTQEVTFVIGNGSPDKTKEVDTKNQPGLLSEVVVVGLGN